MMTFEQWRERGRDVADLRDVPETGLDELFSDQPMEGRVYPVGLYIECYGAQWSLMIENREWISADLGALEARLYTFGADQRCIPD